MSQHDILIAGLVNDEGTALRPARKPGFSVFTEHSNENFALSMQGEQAKRVALQHLLSTARQLKHRLAAFDHVGGLQFDQTIAHYLCENAYMTYEEFSRNLQERARFQLTTLVALSYFYRVSSTGVADHKAVFSIRMLRELIDAGMEGFLVGRQA